LSNPEHADIFTQGVDAWNAWRVENPNVIPDLSGEQFSYEDLRGINFSGMDLSYEDLSSAILMGANFSGAELHHTDLSDAYLQYALFLNADAICINLWGADLEGTNFEGANLAEASLKETNLSGANLKGTNLWCVYLLDAEGLTVEQLAVAKTLCEVIELDAHLLEAIREQHPRVLENKD
jgi:uncharacterized protein YjbI with pentapeptide repeats